jgi:hypothetical protein
MAVSTYRWFAVCSLWLAVSNPAVNKTFELRTSQEGAFHPFYISVVEINHNASDKTLEISCKIFTNDFESTLEKNYKSKVNLSNPKDKASTDKWINDYIKKHLSIKADNKEANFSYLGFEKEDEAIYSYFEVSNIPSVRKIDVSDAILHDFSNQQVNIIHCMVGGRRQSTKLDYPNTNAIFSW